MINKDAFELFNTLNNLDLEDYKGSQFEYAVAKTLRKMRGWQAYYSEAVADIGNEFCAIWKNEKGVEVLLKENLKRTTTGADGKESSEEFQVNSYTKDGARAKTKALRELDKVEVPEVHIFEIHQAASCPTDLPEYAKLVLEEYGFFKTPNDGTNES